MGWGGCYGFWRVDHEVLWVVKDWGWRWGVMGCGKGGGVWRVGWGLGYGGLGGGGSGGGGGEICYLLHHLSSQ